MRFAAAAAPALFALAGRRAVVGPRTTAAVARFGGVDGRKSVVEGKGLPLFVVLVGLPIIIKLSVSLSLSLSLSLCLSLSLS
eukprot:COSAG03_NODE_22335_length_292_cov_0.823834_1_plen_81_part_10